MCGNYCIKFLLTQILMLFIHNRKSSNKTTEYDQNPMAEYSFWGIVQEETGAFIGA